jgi:hypothetical protein
VRSSLIYERLFTSVHTLEESGERIKQRLLGSEMDLHHFLRPTVEEPVASIVAEFYKNRNLRRRFRLHGYVSFENHANTLSPTSLDEDMQEMNLGSKRRRSPRLQGKSQVTASRGSAESNPNTSRPRADQICVYNNGEGVSQAAYISELKAPHKLPLSLIYIGLRDIDLDDIICIQENESLGRQCQRLVAAVITQAFSYMIRSGLEYGSVCTGEASIFLRVDSNDPGTVYYYLSVPKHDVGETTGWTEKLDVENRLHLTAVGQTLAFTIRALQATPRNQLWRDRALNQLDRWRVSYNDILEDIPVADAPSSEYWPTPKNDEYSRMSPIQLRKRAPQATSPSCARSKEDSISSDEDPGPDTPSRTARQPIDQRLANKPNDKAKEKQQSQSDGQGRGNGRTRRYCTHQCLLGLRRGGKLDEGCPNAQIHGKGFHRIGQSTLRQLLKQQLARDPDDGFLPISRPGATGVGFRITLLSHGYTLVAKGSPLWFAQCLDHEAAIYSRLRPLQGAYVPVHLGGIALQMGYLFEGIVVITHLMLLSFAGQRISRVESNNDMKCKVAQSINAVRQLGVRHGDISNSNVLVDERGLVKVIDFDQAKILKPRRVLGDITNRKRKRDGELKTQQKVQDDQFSTEKLSIEI